MRKESIILGDALEVTVTKDARNAARGGEPQAFSEGKEVEDILDVRIVDRSANGVRGGIDPDAVLDHYELRHTPHGEKVTRYLYTDGSTYEMEDFCDSSRCDNCCKHDGIPPWVQTVFRMPWKELYCPMLQRDPDEPTKLLFPPRCTLQMQGGSKEHLPVPMVCLAGPSPVDIDDFIRRFGCTIRYRRVK